MFPREICVPIKERFIHARGIENPRDDGCLHRVLAIRRRRRERERVDTLSPLLWRRSARFQYFGHIAEVWKSHTRDGNQTVGERREGAKEVEEFFSFFRGGCDEKASCFFHGGSRSNKSSRQASNSSKGRRGKVSTKPFSDPVYVSRRNAIAFPASAFYYPTFYYPTLKLKPPCRAKYVRPEIALI